MEIKEIGSEYIDDILELEGDHAPGLPEYYAYDREDLEENMPRPWNFTFGAFDGEKLVGWASCHPNSKDESQFYMSSMVVHTDYRRQGVGQALFDARMKKLAELGKIKSITCTTYPKNAPLLILYLKNGFYIADFKKDLYAPGADRVILRKEL